MNTKGLTCVLSGIIAICAGLFQYSQAGENDINSFYQENGHSQGGESRVMKPENWNQIKQHANDPANDYRSNGKPARLGNAGQEFQQYSDYPGSNYKTHHQGKLNNRGGGHNQRGNSGSCGREYKYMSCSFTDSSYAYTRKDLLEKAGIDVCIERAGNLHRILIKVGYIQNDPQRGCGVTGRP